MEIKFVAHPNANHCGKNYSIISIGTIGPFTVFLKLYIFKLHVCTQIGMCIIS